MPPRKKSAPAGPPTMAELRETLWKAADKLRGSMDAAQYKDFVLGLIFLKYVSDAFVERREQIRQDVLADGIALSRVEDFLDDPDEYSGHGVFWVPEQARWEFIAANAKSAGIGELLNAAMDAVMKKNPPLTGVLPRIFNSESVDQRRLGELVDLLGDARFTGHRTTAPPSASPPPGEDGALFAEPAPGVPAEAVTRSARDVLGEVYEYFLEKFARAEGKRGGEFYTPASVVKLLVEVLEPYSGRVYDPCCGSGGMFVQAEKFVAEHRGLTRKDDIAVYGQESNERTWRLAKMNLAIHGITGDLSSRWDDTFHNDRHPDLRADFILANPPFNMSDWARTVDDQRWRYGTPPAGNANFAWMQHIIAKLGSRGSAGVVMANGSMSSKQSGEGEIRAALVEADLVACMIALPPQLFRTTQIPACLWFFAKDKGPMGARRLAERRGETLFIDARNMGTMIDRTERVLTDDDLAKIAGTYHAWRGTQSAREKNLKYENVPGFCYSATTEEIRTHDHVLTPGRYVGAAELDTSNDEPIADKIARLTKELFTHFEESARLEKEVRTQLERLDV
ncbi:class I SAM-dependent DNA methyltransferase [Frankia sp. CiP1_Cm_nod2]|uniref:class I SAM-dependent DNA methyltransferase n=1 Tax=Frankia sp. CiP1_Cm_nod2 TaxID=2897161 RepID=UPI002024373A